MNIHAPLFSSFFSSPVIKNADEIIRGKAKPGVVFLSKYLFIELLISQCTHFLVSPHDAKLFSQE